MARLIAWIRENASVVGIRTRATISGGSSYGDWPTAKSRVKSDIECQALNAFAYAPASCSGGRSKTSASSGSSATGPFCCAIHADRPRWRDWHEVVTRASGGRGRSVLQQELHDLQRVERGALAEVVAHDHEREPVLRRAVRAD